MVASNGGTSDNTQDQGLQEQNGTLENSSGNFLEDSFQATLTSSTIEGVQNPQSDQQNCIIHNFN